MPRQHPADRQPAPDDRGSVSLLAMAADRRLDPGRPSVGLPTSGVLRFARGTAVGATAMGLAVTGHAVGGRSLPASSTAVALLALTVAGSVALSGRRWTVSALVTVLLGVQAVCHVAFADHPTAAPVADHHHAAHSVTASMLVAHVLAALVTAVLLRRGESWCWRLAALLSRPMHVARVFTARTVPASRDRLVPSADGSLAVLRSLLLADGQPRRGPPALLAR